MSEIDLLDELGPSHDAEECEDRPCDWHIALALAEDVKRLTAERDHLRDNWEQWARDIAWTTVQGRDARIDRLRAKVKRLKANLRATIADLTERRDQARAQRDAANAALAAVSDLLDQARTEREAARAEVAGWLDSQDTVDACAKALWQWNGGLGPWADGEDDDQDSARATVRLVFSTALARAAS